MFTRILINTRKHILRSGWVGWASVFVMTLAFLVVSIFAGLAYGADRYIAYIESKSNLLVFFNVGMDQKIINDLKSKWESNPLIKSVTFLSEEEAYTNYSDYAYRNNLQDLNKGLELSEEKKLNSSLEVQLVKLTDLNTVQQILEQDIKKANDSLIIIETVQSNTTEEQSSIEDENSTDTEATETSLTEELSTDSEEEIVRYQFSKREGEPPITLSVNSETLNKFTKMFTELRLFGVIVMGLLTLVVVFFIFMTTEFRLFNQMEEIGVMQLVGGSLSFIRMPYVLEGGFYGLLGAFISSSLIASFLLAIFKFDLNLAISSFIFDELYQLPWINLDTVGFLLLFVTVCLSGFILGAASSFLSIRRYIR